LNLGFYSHINIDQRP